MFPRIFTTLAVAAASLVAFSGPTRAAVLTYDLSISTIAGFVSNSISYGTATVTDLTPNNVSVSLQLLNGAVFADTGAGSSFAFNTAAGLVGNLHFTNFMTGQPILSGGGGVVGPAGASPFTTGNVNLNYSIDCTTACGTGTSPPLQNYLAFDVTGPASGTTLTALNLLLPLSYQSTNVYFASDIGIPNGNGFSTGNVGGVWHSTTDGGGTGGGSTEVPEPMSMALLGVALTGLGLGRRLFRRRA